MRPLSLLLLSACCRDRAPPRWELPETLELGEESAFYDLRDWAEDEGDLSFQAEGDAGVRAAVDGHVLELAPQPGFEGEAEVRLEATDACGNTTAGTLALQVGGGEDGTAGDCAVTLRYTAQGQPDAVAVAGAFNDWNTEADRLSDQGDGTWAVSLSLDPGAWPYKFVELTEGLYGEEAHWTCDPEAPLIQCDDGYIAPNDTSWSHTCVLDANACNSLLIVEDCAAPTLDVVSLAVDEATGSIDVTVRYTPGTGGSAASAEVLLDGEPLEGAWDGEGFTVALDGLEPTRHTLRFSATDAQGNAAEEVVVPVWLDGRGWEQAVLYYAFVDRLNNGDTSLDTSEGASAAMGEYLGGDWQGLLDLLPYLDDLGITALWITNPTDNASGAWDGQCEETYTGYHGYWPVSGQDLEEHFGDEALFREVIDQAHARGMRVIVDWVGNHLHEEHPDVTAHPDWFNDYVWCEDADNWNDLPESCWFAPYLPDIDYGQAEPLHQYVEEAVDLALRWDLDGLRIDAAKHMPHSVLWNLEQRIQARIEHRAAGGTDSFWTVGETFDGYDRIAAYIGEDQLDGQFDFPLYYALRAALLDESITLADLADTAAYSPVAYGGALMGTFLGNHDVARFVTEGAEEDVDACDSDGSGVRTAGDPDGTAAHEALRLAFTFLLTRPGVPLVYYGDEVGIPGYGDPDNRQPLWEWTGDLSAVSTVEDLAASLDDQRAATVRQVAVLARARADHPALWASEGTEWWREDDVYAWATVVEDDAALVLLNRSRTERTLSNGLGFAALPVTGRYTDIISGDTTEPSGDLLTVTVPARSSAVYIWSK